MCIHVFELWKESGVFRENPRKHVDRKAPAGILTRILAMRQRLLPGPDLTGAKLCITKKKNKKKTLWKNA